MGRITKWFCGLGSIKSSKEKHPQRAVTLPRFIVYKTYLITCIRRAVLNGFHI